MIAWILFGLMLVLHAAAFALAACHMARRGDEAMEDYFRSLKPKVQSPKSPDGEAQS